MWGENTRNLIYEKFILWREYCLEPKNENVIQLLEKPSGDITVWVQVHVIADRGYGVH